MPGFVSKARVSACMYFLVYYMYLCIQLQNVLLTELSRNGMGSKYSCNRTSCPVHVSPLILMFDERLIIF